LKKKKISKKNFLHEKILSSKRAPYY